MPNLNFYNKLAPSYQGGRHLKVDKWINVCGVAVGKIVYKNSLRRFTWPSLFNFKMFQCLYQ